MSDFKIPKKTESKPKTESKLITAAKKVVERKSRPRFEIITELHEKMSDFLGELVERFPEESDFLVIRMFMIEQLPIEDLINKFNKYVMPLRKQVKERNDDFFIQEEDLFSGIKETGKVAKFKKIWLDPETDDDTKAVIWTWFDKFIQLTDEINNTEKT